MADEEFRIAFCIECHKYTPVLEELCERLQHPQTDIFIHVDGKSDIAAFKSLESKAHLLSDRCDVYWGGISQINCMLKLFDATRKGNYRYIVLISGDTLPLVPIERIYNFLQKNYPLQFVHMTSDLMMKEIVDKIHWRLYIAHKKWIALLPGFFRKQIRKRFHPSHNPYTKSLPPLEYGSNWITITDEFRDHAFDYLSHNPQYMEYFKPSSCGDEIFFHTIMGISKFAEQNTRFGLLYVRWEGVIRPPKVFTTADLPELQRARDEEREVPYFFARKINDHIDLERYRETFPLHDK